MSDFSELFKELQSLQLRLPEIERQLVNVDAQIFSVVGRIKIAEADPENKMTAALSQDLEGLKELRAGLLEEHELIRKQINEVEKEMN